MLLKILKKIFLEDPKIDEEMDADEKRKMYQAGPKPGANLTGANLTGANLYLAWLGEADLTNANLTGAKLIKADLTNANLTRANLANAWLPWADLIGAASCSVSVLLAPPLSAYS